MMNMIQNDIKRLPLGFSNLKDLLTSHCVYVDKTKQLCHLIQKGAKFTLFTRPRRFGKSLLVSTLEEIFLGNKELFKNLWIGSTQSSYDWKSYPIIRIDFSNIESSSPQLLRQALSLELDTIALRYNVSLSSVPRENLGAKLTHLVRSLAIQEQVILLIDEYDHPLIAHGENKRLLIKNTEVLRTFYTALKSLNEHIKFFFVTGVSKFPQQSIFSGLNNVTDISFYPEYAALAGYTEEEINTHFSPYIKTIAAERSCAVGAVLNEMREWYNGYHFSSTNVGVYNPFSLLNYLQTKVSRNYWFLSGTPTFLIDMLRAHSYTAQNIEDALTLPSTLAIYNSEKPPLEVLLYQTGYLTIASTVSGGSAYKLTYPNYEVRLSMNQNLLSFFTSAEPNKIAGLRELLKDALTHQNPAEFTTLLGSLLAHIPYNLHIEKESYYHSIFHAIGSVLGFDTQSEVLTSVGRIDIVIQDQKTIFIMELKCNKSAHEALEQIKSRRYYEKFISSGKAIFLIGLGLQFPEKKLTMQSLTEKLSLNSPK